MNASQAATASIATLLVGLLLSGPTAAQTIFTTEDFRQDREHWTDPAYYRNNTVEELRGMALDLNTYGADTGQLGRARFYGQEGTGQVDATDLESPYPYTSAWEHYQAWFEDAGGGTQHTRETIPDWSGRWSPIDATLLAGGPNPASSVAAMLKAEYREHFVQDLKAKTEGRIWAAGSFCLPGGFIRSVTQIEEIVVTPERTWTLGADNGATYTRRIYTDDSGHTAEDFQYPKWHGESIGFWDGDALVIHTNQIRGWKGGLSEFTDNLEAVERYRRVGDIIEGEITLYDSAVFVLPAHSKIDLELDSETRPELRPLFNTCTDTNGPSTKVFMDERGFLNERLPGDPLYWDSTDPRPWATYLNISDERYEKHRESLEAEGNQ